MSEGNYEVTVRPEKAAVVEEMKEQLLGMVASALLAPITGLACALNGNIQNLAYALEAVRKQKESA